MKFLSRKKQFDELFYLGLNPDVEEAVRRGVFPSGREHWLKYGKKEGRVASPDGLGGDYPEGWDEYEYLRANLDVASAVRAGHWKSGFAHWKRLGAAEGRPGGPPLITRAARSEVLRRRPAGCNFYGFQARSIGLGTAAKGNLEVLRAIAGNLATVELPWGSEDWAAGPPKYDPARAPYALNFLHMNPDVLPHFLTSFGPDALRDYINIAYWAWELHAGYANWSRFGRLFHEIWTPSRYVAESVATVTKTHIKVVPHVVDRLPDGLASSRADLGWPEGVCVFLYVFDIASIIQRKNPGGLIRAFRRAFGDRGDVLLVLKYHHEEFDKAGTRIIEAMAAGCPNIKLINATVSRDELCSMLQRCDCFVSPHRSEGFGLNLATAMYYGKPVIATGYSGNMDFTNGENSFLLDYDLVSVDSDAGPYRSGYVWADPSVSHLAHLLQQVAANPEEARRRGEAGRQYVLRHFSFDAVCAVARQHLGQLADADGPANEP